MSFETGVQLIGRVVEACGVAAIVVGIVVASVRWGRRLGQPRALAGYRRDIGGALLLGLELLVAADIIGTITTHPSIEGVLVLSVIVLIRTLLSFSIELEVEGRLPWQRAQGSSSTTS